MKIGIVTIIDNRNLGNRLQNFATQSFLREKFNTDVVTIKNSNRLGRNENVKNRIVGFLRDVKYFPRTRNFCRFNRNIKMTRKTFDCAHNNSSLDKYFNYFVVGSDQVWNPNFGWLNSMDLLQFAKPSKRVAFSASFGISDIPKSYNSIVGRELLKFNAISVREDAGREIVEHLTDRNDVEVLIDPTMLIEKDEWNRLAKKPKQIKDNRPIVLKYFLGRLSDEKKKAIEEFAKKHGCQIVDIYDKSSKFYSCGPSEFLWLEENAYLVCTDSFHASVFAILYKRPFVVFERDSKHEKMNSRLDTLIAKFNLKNRVFNGDRITDENFNVCYDGIEDVLDRERKKALAFLNNAFGRKD